jgi:NADPH-dependent glutamate synthase beta subunit-like oxidoreductase
VSVSIVIVGGGPSGFYAADALLRKLPDCRIDIVDRLPTPYGLVRGGVAPDHQSTKAVQRVFERTATRPNVRFLGHVNVGNDVSYEELRASYDAVVIAIGCPVDRKLGVPGEELRGVYGSWSFVAWYNGHPDHRDLDPGLAGGTVGIVGNGNVAIDCARVLAKTPAEMAKSDLCRHAAETIARAPIEELCLIGRRGPVQAGFTPIELAELGRLERCVPLVDGEALERDIAAADPEEVVAKAKPLDILRSFAGNRPGDKPVRLRFLFWAAPAAILGEGRVQGLRLERTRLPDGRAGHTGDYFELPVSTVITAIGYVSAPFDGLPMDEKRGIVRNVEGRVAPGVYVAGWSKRGPSGTIPTNRTDAMAIADLIVADLATGGTGKPGPSTLDRILAARAVRPVGFAEWLRVNEAEMKRAADGRPREKFTRILEMLAACRD